MENSQFRRLNGQYGSNHERSAFKRGLEKGLRWGIQMGVAMAARAYNKAVQEMWDAIKSRRSHSK